MFNNNIQKLVSDAYQLMCRMTQIINISVKSSVQFFKSLCFVVIMINTHTHTRSKCMSEKAPATSYYKELAKCSKTNCQVSYIVWN